jgi:hypothetical protein
MNPPELEDILRRAPAPRPSARLKDRLLSAIALPTSDSPQPQPARLSPEGRVPRWLGMAAGFAAILWIAWGAVHRHQLAQHNEQLTQSLRALQAEAPPSLDTERIALLQHEIQRLRDQTRELHRLRAEVAALRPLVGELEALRQEKQELLESLAQQANQLAITPVPAVEPNDEKDQSHACLNHLKQIALAARIWAGDNGDIFPPDLISMANELSTPMVLHCPADAQRPVMSNWAQFQPHLSSYEYLNPNGSFTEPHVVLARCRVHGHVVLSDGRVLGGTAFNSGNRQLITRDGKLELLVPEAEQDDPNSPGYYERLMMKRYGLIPGRSNADDSPTNAPPQQEQSHEQFW